MAPTTTNLLRQTALLLGLVTLAGLYFRYDPAQVSFFPPCPFRLLTGWQCPGCGSQRCLHQLLHGQFGRAYHHNPLLVLSLPYVLVGLALEYSPLKRRYSTLYRKGYGQSAALVAFGIIVCYWIGRNLL